MILQALSEYYDRKANLPDFGWANLHADFEVVLKDDGSFVSINPLGEKKGAKWMSKPMKLPAIGKQAFKHSNSGTDANLLWDNSKFVFNTEPNKNRLRYFLDTIDAWLGEIDLSGVRALKAFLNEGLSKSSHFDPILNHSEFGSTIRGGSSVIVFKLAGLPSHIHEAELVSNRIEEKMKTLSENLGEGICLLSGNTELIAKTHNVTKGVTGAKTSGANIISFNKRSFDSYGKSQAGNSPVSIKQAFAYTTALDDLLDRKNGQRLAISDATTVFWSQKNSDLEKQIVDIFGDPPKDDPAKGTQAVKSLFKSVQSGALEKDESSNKFYVLGLAPNSARIAVRFWIADTVPAMAEHIVEHFWDIAITHHAAEAEYLSLNGLLACSAQIAKFDKDKTNLVRYKGKFFDARPNLSGESMRSILCGLPYPETLLQAVLRRIKAEQSAKTKEGKPAQNVTYPRAALIKAFINRKTRFHNPKIKEELKVSLDKENTNIGYRLGRLFAALEKLQSEANPGINATIRDKFYASASSSPVAAFPHLTKLSGNHLSKLRKEKPHREHYFDSLLGEINDGIPSGGFPAHLPIADQGRFAIGYYHQRQDFFKGKDKIPSAAADAVEEQSEKVTTS